MIETTTTPHRCESSEALAAIAQLLDGNEWDSDTVNAVADVIRSAGFHICDPEEFDR